MSDFLNSNQLYPLKFTPIYQARIWGGTQMTEVLHREVPPSEDPIGESWEIVDREGENSVLGQTAPWPGKRCMNCCSITGANWSDAARNRSSVSRFS